MDAKALEDACGRVLAVDPAVRSARIISGRGHLEAGGMREGVEPLEERRHDEMMFMELALRVRMRSEFDAELGPVHFSLSYREKVVVMSFPLAGGGVLLASAERSADIGRLPFSILAELGGLGARQAG